MQKKSAPFQLPPVLVAMMGVVMASWVSFGRHLFDKGGPFTIVYVLLVGIPVVIMHLVIAKRLGRLARSAFQQSRATVTCLITAWVLFTGLGLTIPDRPISSLETIVTGASEPWLGMAIGIANPLGIIGLALTVAALLLSKRDLAGAQPTEDEILDAAGY